MRLSFVSIIFLFFGPLTEPLEYRLRLQPLQKIHRHKFVNLWGSDSKNYSFPYFIQWRESSPPPHKEKDHTIEIIFVMRSSFLIGFTFFYAFIRVKLAIKIVVYMDLCLYYCLESSEYFKWNTSVWKYTRKLIL